MFKELNPILHSQLRLAIMSILLTVEEAEFVYLKEKTQSTAGNLSVQLDKLSEAGYIEVGKKLCRQKAAYCLPDHCRRQESDGGICGDAEGVSFGVVVHAPIKLSDNFAFSLFSSTFAPRNK